mmetsp:Transcript_70972/g.230419  ORF Transcript_70972/g.230419 Transcript_70972/m.230419 type:complete len:213 (+) Transcript_70972:206-844(+)
MRRSLELCGSASRPLARNRRPPRLRGKVERRRGLGGGVGARPASVAGAGDKSLRGRACVWHDVRAAAVAAGPGKAERRRGLDATGQGARRASAAGAGEKSLRGGIYVWRDVRADAVAAVPGSGDAPLAGRPQGRRPRRTGRGGSTVAAERADRRWRPRCWRRFNAPGARRRLREGGPTTLLGLTRRLRERLGGAAVALKAARRAQPCSPVPR